jgi:hypothetical protein
VKVGERLGVAVDTGVEVADVGTGTAEVWVDSAGDGVTEVVLEQPNSRATTTAAAADRRYECDLPIKLTVTSPV